MVSNHIDTNHSLVKYSDPFPGKDAAELVFNACPRCGGSGYIAGFEHVANAVCFGCMGNKGETITVEVARKREKGRVYRENKYVRDLIKKQTFHNEQMAKAEAAFPILAGWLESISEDNFMMDLWEKAFKYELSEKQVAAAAANLQRKADRKAEREQEAADAADAPSGKLTVEGEIVSVKFKDSQYGGAWKMVVKHESGWKCWGSIPTAIFDQQRDEAADGVNPFADDLKGRKVSFSATLEVSEEDRSFAFFKRPTKAILLPAE